MVEEILVLNDFLNFSLEHQENGDHILTIKRRNCIDDKPEPTIILCIDDNEIIKLRKVLEVV